MTCHYEPSLGDRRISVVTLGDQTGPSGYDGYYGATSNEGLVMMIDRIRAVYRDGAFRPAIPCDYPENHEVELLVQEPTVRDPSVSDSDERIRILRQITERMQKNPIPAGAPRFSRDEIHERT